MNTHTHMDYSVSTAEKTFKNPCKRKTGFYSLPSNANAAICNT